MGEEQGTLSISLLSKSQKMGRCLNVSILESIFLHLQAKSLPLPKAAHHCLTKKFSEVHLCLKSLILLYVSFQLKSQSESLCRGNGAAVQQEVQGSQQSSLQAHGV